jgi:hypothetical protein
VFLQPSGIVIQDAGILAPVIDVSSEYHVLYTAVKRFFLGAIQNYLRLPPVADPKSVVERCAGSAHSGSDHNGQHCEHQGKRQTASHMENLRFPLPRSIVATLPAATLALLPVWPPILDLRLSYNHCFVVFFSSPAGSPD